MLLLHGLAAAQQRLLVLLPFLLILFSFQNLGLGVEAAKDPAVTVNRFVTLPAKVYYFVDSPIALWFSRDEGNLWRSEDEGKSWSPIEGPPKGEANQLIEHPYDKSTVSRGYRGLRLDLSLMPPFSVTGIHSDQAQGALANDRPRANMAEVHDTREPCRAHPSVSLMTTPGSSNADIDSESL